MQSLLDAWGKLDTRRRLTVIVATLAMFIAVLSVARFAGQKDFALLFGGLDPAAAGEVVTALDQQGVAYEVRGGAIYVESTQRDALRLSLAGQGLPAAGTQGYELLDNLSGFGTTSQMFDAAYWRAREGELARTIQSSPYVRSARVHISTPAGRPFQRDQPPTAAVTVSTGGGALSAQQIQALQYLVGSAVNGLDPASVAVIDDSGGLISNAGDAPASGLGDARAELLRDRAERLLAARVGPGNAVVEVSVDTVTESESIIERTVDPDSRIAISTDVTETAATSQDSRGGDVTVASNLPDGDAGNAGNAASENSETRALTNYEVSETERQITRGPGDVRRLTVAVLVNDVATEAPDGSVTFTPRPAEELAALEELVSSAVGLDPARGDQITLRSLPFDDRVALGTAAPVSAMIPGNLNLMQLIQLAVAALVALVLGLFVVRPILANERRNTALPAPDGDDQDELDALDAPMSFAQVGSDDYGGGDDNDGFGGGFAGDFDGGGATDAVGRLRQMIAERESETVQILQDWMEEPADKERV